MTALPAYEGEQERPNPSFEQTALPGFKQTLTARRSIRVYDGSPIPEREMRDCLRDATLAPSSSNLQPYELHWVSDPAKKRALAEACLGQPAATTAGELVVIVARGDLWDMNRKKLLEIMTANGTKKLAAPLLDYYKNIVPLLRKTDPLGINNFMRRLNFWFKGRSEPIVRTPVSHADHRVWANVQASLVAQTLMLSFSAHGYDSCAIGGMDKLRIRKLLALPKSADIAMVISAGRGKREGLYGPRVRFPYEHLVKEVW